MFKHMYSSKVAATLTRSKSAIVNSSATFVTGRLSAGFVKHSALKYAQSLHTTASRLQTAEAFEVDESDAIQRQPKAVYEERRAAARDRFSGSRPDRGFDRPNRYSDDRFGGSRGGRQPFARDRFDRGAGRFGGRAERQERVVEDDDAKDVLLNEEDSFAEAADEAVVDNVLAEHKSKSDYEPVPFSSMKNIVRRETLESIRRLSKYSHMSHVQHQILSQMPIKSDLLVKSKTGTGKTLAFLIPALERTAEFMDRLLAENGTAARVAGRDHCTTFIITPTRELAIQIAAEARRLVYYYPGMKAQVLVGGEDRNAQLRRLTNERVDIIVGTPGRLNDFLQTEPMVRQMLKSVQTCILDEADTLLDMGFKRDIERLVDYLPKEAQTYMFSATVSPQIRTIAERSLQPGFTYIDTVPPNESNVHEQIKQEYVILDKAEDQLLTVFKAIVEEQNKNPYAKIIVFFPTTKMTQLYAKSFKVLRRAYPVQTVQQFEIHAQRDQERRMKTSKAFRSANSGAVLFTSDVSARGVDYPGVTLVIQIGAAKNRDMYIHRVGRTGRAGKDGRGLLILNDFERQYLEETLTDLPLQERKLTEDEIALTKQEEKVLSVVQEFTDPAEVRAVHASTLGYYGTLQNAGVLGSARSSKVIEEFGEWVRNFGVQEVPFMSDQFLAKIGFADLSTARGSSRFGGSRGGRGGYSNDRFSRDSGRFERSRFNDRGGSGGRFDRFESRGSDRFGGSARRDRY